MFNDPDSPKLVQLEDILKTYVMYNFDLGAVYFRVRFRLLDRVYCTYACFLYL